MERYLVRLENNQQYTPQDVGKLASRIREVLGTREALGHLRVSGRAVEFDLFAKNKQTRDSFKTLLEHRVGRIITLKPLDKAPIPGDKEQILKEGLALFNEERFWESHEVLEQVWQPARGEEREVIQGLILTAAALVHAQRNRNDRCIAMLKKALQKLSALDNYGNIDLTAVRRQVEDIISTGGPRVFQISTSSRLS